MIKDFKEEIGLIYNNNQAREKLLTLKVYNVFYDCIIEALSSCNSDIIEYYKSILRDTFKVTVRTFSLCDDTNFDAKRFMRIYIGLFEFKCQNIQNIDDIKGIIVSFNNGLFDGSPLFDDEIIKVVDKYEFLSFDTKVNIMLQFYEFCRNIYFGLKHTFNKEVSSKLDSDISKILLIKLEDYLKDTLNKGINLNESIDNIKTLMMITAKDYLMNKLNNGEFGVETINKQFSIFDEFERTLWLASVIYAIVGYDEYDLPKETLEKLKKDAKNIPADEYISFAQSFIEKIGIILTQTDDDSPKRM